MMPVTSSHRSSCELLCTIVRHLSRRSTILKFGIGDAVFLAQLSVLLLRVMLTARASAVSLDSTFLLLELVFILCSGDPAQCYDASVLVLCQLCEQKLGPTHLGEEERRGGEWGR